MLVINKYIEDNSTTYELAKLYGVPLAAAIPFLEWGWQAEKDRKTLLNFDDKKYKENINEIVSIIFKSLGIEEDNTTSNKTPWYKKLLNNKK